MFGSNFSVSLWLRCESGGDSVLSSSAKTTISSCSFKTCIGARFARPKKLDTWKVSSCFQNLSQKTYLQVLSQPTKQKLLAGHWTKIPNDDTPKTSDTRHSHLHSVQLVQIAFLVSELSSGRTLGIERNNNKLPKSEELELGQQEWRWTKRLRASFLNFERCLYIKQLDLPALMWDKLKPPLVRALYLSDCVRRSFSRATPIIQYSCWLWRLSRINSRRGSAISSVEFHSSEPKMIS